MECRIERATFSWRRKWDKVSECSQSSAATATAIPMAQGICANGGRRVVRMKVLSDYIAIIHLHCNPKLLNDPFPWQTERSLRMISRVLQFLIFFFSSFERAVTLLPSFLNVAQTLGMKHCPFLGRRAWWVFPSLSRSKEANAGFNFTKTWLHVTLHE